MFIKDIKDISIALYYNIFKLTLNILETAKTIFNLTLNILKTIFNLTLYILEIIFNLTLYILKTIINASPRN
jgi:hypothetical protein